MVSFFKYSNIVILLCFLNSCTKEIEIEIPGFEEQLVIDGQIEVGQPPIVLISSSKDIYSPTDLNAFLSGFKSGAVVTMNDGTTTYSLIEVCSDELPPGTEEMAAALFGIPVEQLANYHICAYTSFDPQTFGQVGKTYTLNVSFEGKSYSGTTAIYPPTSLDSLWWEPEYEGVDYGFSYAILSDNPASYDAYRWEVKRLNQYGTVSPVDVRYKATFSPVFDDEFVNGQTFEFYYENPMTSGEESVQEEYRGRYRIGDTVVVKLSKMDAGVFDFLNAKMMQMQSNGNPFSSPINVKSNLSGGCLGLWAGYSPTYDTLICGQ